MRRRTFLTGTMGLAGALALGACATDEEPTEGAREEGGGEDEAVARPTLRLPGGDSGFPSPFAYMRGPGYIQASLIYDTLVWKDSTGELLPWLAESWEESDDNRSYTFKLRDGITWHDG